MALNAPPISSDVAKPGYEHVEQRNASPAASDEKHQLGAGFETHYTPAEQSKIIHKIDRRLVTTVGLMYCISLMDRTNLSAANIAGMEVELELDVGYRYVRSVLY